MKTLIIIIFSILLMASTTFASPFLICDPQTGITQYQIEVKQQIGTPPAWNVIETTTFAAQADTSAKWDLAKYTVGLYSFRLKAADAKGWWSDFSDPFDAIKCGKPGGVKITP